MFVCVSVCVFDLRVRLQYFLSLEQIKRCKWKVLLLIEGCLNGMEGYNTMNNHGHVVTQANINM